MYEAKTKPTEVSVARYLAAIDDDARRKDCKEIAAMMKRATGCAPKMWGSSIVGFDRYHYKYASGHEGDSCLVGFSSRKSEIVVYLLPGYEEAEIKQLLAQLGKHKLGKACLYIKRLADVQTTILEQLVTRSVVEMRKRYPPQGKDDALKTKRAQQRSHNMPRDKTSATKVKSASGSAQSVDAYIAAAAEDVRPLLEAVRTTVRKAAPSAEERISYRIPAFFFEGPLVYFAAFKKHIGFYPPVRDPALQPLLAQYAGPKGNLQFPLSEPMPLALIRKIVKARLRENRAQTHQ